MKAIKTILCCIIQFHKKFELFATDSWKTRKKINKISYESKMTKIYEYY